MPSLWIATNLSLWYSSLSSHGIRKHLYTFLDIPMHIQPMRKQAQPKIRQKSMDRHCLRSMSRNEFHWPCKIHFHPAHAWLVPIRFHLRSGIARIFRYIETSIVCWFWCIAKHLLEFPEPPDHVSSVLKKKNGNISNWIVLLCEH